MRVLISTSTFPVRPGDGMPRFVYDLAEALTAHCEVIVLAPGAPGAPSFERMGPIAVHRFSYFWPRRAQRLAYGGGMRENMRHSLLARIQPPTYLAAQFFALRRLVRERAFDVVNSHWLVPQGLTTAMARAVGGKFAHVLSVHAADVYLLEKMPLGRPIARFVLDRTEHVFADGSHVRDALDRLSGRATGGVLQPMGVHTSVFARPGTAEAPIDRFPEGYLLFFGRFVEKKGVIYLIRAMPKVLQGHPGLGLVLIGYGPLEDTLRAEVGRLGIEESVSFAGRGTHEEIAGALRGCRLAVVPSVIDSHGETDGMPTVVLEAMASGTPVVASAVDGIPDVVRQGENGWLCREKDPDELAETILVALAARDLTKFSQRAAETAFENDWERVARRYSETFQRLRRSARRGVP